MTIRTDGIYAAAQARNTKAKHTRNGGQTTTPEFLSWGTRVLRSHFMKTIKSLTGGHIRCEDPLGSFENHFTETTNLPTIQLNIKSMDFYRSLITAGSLGAAESYIQGNWAVNHLTGLIQLMIRNRATLDKLDGKSSWLAKKLAQIWHKKTRNSKFGAKKNISAHYDLSNEFFKLFLDEHMMYSSAIYKSHKDTLNTASTHKLETICRGLALAPSDHLIEIGTGWGGLACYAAENYGCRVTTTTISDEQFHQAKETVKRKGLDHLVTVLNQDYRDLSAGYDKLVSIEMVEAVGHQYLPAYFETCARLIKPGGTALLQAITIEDHRYELSLNEIDFIKKYVFPGSFIPSTSLLVSEAGKVKLKLKQLTDFGQSYAKTLNAWRAKFKDNRAQVTQLGFSEEFQRLWEFYLCYCEGGFIEESISCQHLVFSKLKNN